MNSKLMSATVVAIVFCFSSATADVLEKKISFEAAAGYEFFELCNSIDIPCGVELAAPNKGDSTSIHVEGISAKKVLASVLTRYPGHRWALVAGALNVRPKLSPKNSPLDRQAISIRLEGKTLDQISVEISKMLKIGGGSRSISGFDESENDSRKISVVLERGTFRDVLDKAVRTHGHAMWILERSTTPDYPDHYDLRILSYWTLPPGATIPGRSNQRNL